MLQKILVALDGSELAERALSFATALSIPTAARLVLVRVVAAHTFPGIDERESQVRALPEAEIYLRGVAATLVSRGLAVELATPYGEHPADWIIQEAGLRHADLIVMSTHGRTGPGRWIFGSVTERCGAESGARARPTLVGRQPPPAVAGRSSARAGAAGWLSLRGERAASRSQPRGRYRAEVVLVRVEATPHDVKVAEEDVGTYFDAEEVTPLTQLQGYLREVSQQVKDRSPDLRVSRLIEAGDPADGIAAAAAESQAALVIMATHGRTGLSRTALGSVAGRVLQHSDVPLALMHPHAPAATEAQLSETRVPSLTF